MPRLAGARRRRRRARPDTAIDAWQHAERLRPRDFDLLFNLGMVLADSGRGAEALPYLTRFMQEAPRDRYARDFPRVGRRSRRHAGDEAPARLRIAGLVSPRPSASPSAGGGDPRRPRSCRPARSGARTSCS
jgi:tetratricopeptide (TPR) repeat protein